MKSKTQLVKTLAIGYISLWVLFGQIVSAKILYATDGAGVFEVDGNKRTSHLYQIDSQSGEVTKIGPIGFMVGDIAWDRTRGTLFGVSMGIGRSGRPVPSLITINTSTGQGELIGKFTNDPENSETISVIQIDVDSMGRMIGVSKKFLLEIDSDTGITIFQREISAPDSGGGEELPFVLTKYGVRGLSFDRSDTLWGRLTDSDQFISANTGTGNLPIIDFYRINNNEVKYTGAVDFSGAGYHGTFDLETDQYWALHADVIEMYNKITGAVEGRLRLVNAPENTGQPNQGLRAKSKPKRKPGGKHNF